MNYLSPWIETTNRCNLRCSYCYLEKENIDMGPEVYETMASQFINFINNGNIDFIKLRIAGGEPLLVFDKWKEPVDYFLRNAKERGQAELLTNLVKIPEGFIDYAKSQERLGINVSLDSLVMSKPFPNGKSSSKKVLKNINKLKDDKDIFIMTVLTENGRYLPDLAEYITENKFGWDIQLDKFYEADIDKKAVIENMRKVVDVFNRKKLPIHEFLLFNFCNFGSRETSCSAGHEMFYINPFGKIYNCQTQEYGEPITDINDKDILTKLEGNKMERPYLFKCGDCKIEDFCQGDCPVHNDSKRREYFCEIMEGYFLPAAKNVLEFEKRNPAK